MKNISPKQIFGDVMVLLIMTLMLVSTSCKSADHTSDPYKTGFLVDVRTPEEFAAGSVEGAVNIPLQELEYRLGEFEGKDQIVVMCRSGNRSRQAKEILEQHGFTNVTDGGSWQSVAIRAGGN